MQVLEWAKVSQGERMSSEETSLGYILYINLLLDPLEKTGRGFSIS
jgi:hypothetical protein